MSPKTAAASPNDRGGFFPHLLATLLFDRKLALALSSAAGIMIVLQLSGLPSWQCPLDAVFGKACPGCGLTRALGQMLVGNWQMAIEMHQLAPLAALAIALLALVAVLPPAVGHRVATVVSILERRSGCTFIIISLWFATWISQLKGI